METDISRSRSRRLEKGNPISPSKLTKRELHERYFNLVENNIDLKKTVNAQIEQLRVLSTRLLRVNNSQKGHLCRTPTQCCINAHKLIEVLRATMDDLQQSNLKLTARNRMLGMRLSTQKQFSKISPNRASSKFRVSSAVDFSRQNTNRTMDSEVALKVQSNLVTTARSPRDCESNDSDAQTVISKDVQESERNSNRNPDSQAIELLKITISNLEEELKAARSASSAHEERSRTLSAELVRLEEEMRAGVRAAGQRNLQEHRHQLQQLTAQMREAQGAANSLIAELAIEKKKVIELKARLKAAAMANDVINMLEDHLRLVTKNHNDHSALHTVVSTITSTTKLVETANQTSVSNSRVTCSNLTEMFPELKNILPVHSDDEMSAVEIIRKLTKKVSILQSELDVLEVSKINKISKTSHSSDETIKGDALSDNDVSTGNSAFGNRSANMYIKSNNSVCTSNDTDEVLNNTDDDYFINFIDENDDENTTNWERSAKFNADDKKDANTNTANDNNVKVDVSMISVNAESAFQLNDNVASDPCIISTHSFADKKISLENVNNNQWNVKRSEELSIRKIQSDSVIPSQTNIKKPAEMYTDESKKLLLNENASIIICQPSADTTNLSYGEPAILKNEWSLASNKTYMKVADAKSDKLSVQSLSSGNTERDVASIANTSETEKTEKSLSEVERDRELSGELTSSEYTSYSYSESAEADATLNMFSDGEIPTSRERIRRVGSGATVGARTTSLTKVGSSSEAVNVSSKSTSIQVEETLRAINVELHKCQVLLRSQKSPPDPTFEKL